MKEIGVEKTGVTLTGVKEIVPVIAAKAASAVSPSSDQAGLLSRLHLMASLAASLERSREALLALDLAEIEGGTQEQRGLLGELAVLPPWDAMAERDLLSVLARKAVPAGACSAAAPNTNAAAAGVAGLERELTRTQLRVDRALRLHMALLARLRRKLQILANVLASTGRLYSPMTGNRTFLGCGPDRVARGQSLNDMRREIEGERI